MPVDHKKIRDARKRKGITQEEARVAAGLNSVQHWSNIERGQQTSESISVDLLERIAKALGVKPSDLLK